MKSVLGSWRDALDTSRAKYRRSSQHHSSRIKNSAAKFLAFLEFTVKSKLKATNFRENKLKTVRNSLFYTLRKHYFTSRFLKQKLRRLSSRTALKTLQTLVSSWKRTAAHKRSTTKQVSSFRSRQSQKQSFSALKSSTATTRLYFAALTTQFQLTKALNSWLKFMKHRYISQKQASQALAHYKSSRCRRYFSAFSSQCRLVQSQQRLLFSFWDRKLSKILNLWQGALLALPGQEFRARGLKGKSLLWLTTERNSCLFRRIQLLGKSFTSLQTSKSQQLSLRKARCYSNFAVLSSHFSQWRVSLHTLSHKKQVLSRTQALYSRSSLQVALCTWKRLPELQFTPKATSQCPQHSRKLLRKSLYALQKSCSLQRSHRKTQRAARRYHRFTLQHRIFALWLSLYK